MVSAVVGAVLLTVKLGLQVPWTGALSLHVQGGTRFRPEAVVAGLVVGLLLGLTGMGSGAVMAPVLILVLHMRPAAAVGTDLVYASITKLFGALQHWKHGFVDIRLLTLLSAGSIPGAALGAWSIQLLQIRYGAGIDSILLRSLALMFVLTGITILMRLLRPSTREGSTCRPGHGAPAGSIVLLGAVTGSLVGFTSVGAGSVLMAVLLIFYPAPAVALVGTGVVHAVLVTGVTGAFHLLAGNVQLPLVLNLLLGSVPGVLLGSRLVGRLPDRSIRTALALLLVVTGAELWAGSLT